MEKTGSSKFFILIRSVQALSVECSVQMWLWHNRTVPVPHLSLSVPSDNEKCAYAYQRFCICALDTMAAFCVRFDNNSLNNIFIASPSRSSNKIYVSHDFESRCAMRRVHFSYARGILRTSGVHRVDSITQFSGAPRKGTYYLRLLAGWRLLIRANLSIAPQSLHMIL